MGDEWISFDPRYNIEILEQTLEERPVSEIMELIAPRGTASAAMLKHFQESSTITSFDCQYENFFVSFTADDFNIFGQMDEKESIPGYLTRIFGTTESLETKTNDLTAEQQALQIIHKTNRELYNKRHKQRLMADYYERIMPQPSLLDKRPPKQFVVEQPAFTQFEMDKRGRESDVDTLATLVEDIDMEQVEERIFVSSKRTKRIP